MTDLERLTTAKAHWQKLQETGKNPDGTTPSKNTIAGAPGVIKEIDRRIQKIMEAGK